MFIRSLILVTVLAASAAVPADAQMRDATALADSLRRNIETAATHANLGALSAARALAERAVAAYPDDAWMQHYLGYALYREATLRSDADPDAAGKLLKQAETALERSAELRPIPETHALLSAVLGMQIGSNPLKGMTLGMRIGKQTDRALELGPDNPRVWMIRGTGALYTPRMFGGGANKAERYFRKALELFPQDRPAPPLPAWGYAEAYAWLGQVYAREKQSDRARDAYAAALCLEPEFAWVRDVLLPQLEKAQK